MKSSLQYGLNDFIEDMTEVVEEIKEDAFVVPEAERLVGKLIRTKSWLPSDKLASDQNHYARHSLYLDPQDRFEVIALVWRHGQRTPLHDHDGTWGVEGVLYGRMKVANYLQIETLSNQLVKLHYSGAMTFGEQSTGQLLPPADCHILEADGEEAAVTIHVYGKRLQKFKVFESVGKEEGLYKTSLSEVGYTTAAAIK